MIQPKKDSFQLTICTDPPPRSITETGFFGAALTPPMRFRRKLIASHANAPSSEPLITKTSTSGVMTNSVCKNNHRLMY